MKVWDKERFVFTSYILRSLNNFPFILKKKKAWRKGKFETMFTVVFFFTYIRYKKLYKFHLQRVSVDYSPPYRN